MFVFRQPFRPTPEESAATAASRPNPARSIWCRFVEPVARGGVRQAARRRLGSRRTMPEPLQVQQQAGGVRRTGGWCRLGGVGGHGVGFLSVFSRSRPRSGHNRTALMVPYGIGATAIAPRTAWKLRLTRRNSYCALRVPLSQSENPVSGCPAAQSPAVYAFQQSGGFEPLCCQLNGSLA